MNDWSAQALVHKSYCNEHPGLSSNERLEFLGDSVLSLIVSERLFKLFPESAEGDLTTRRSNLVQTTTLAIKAKELGLDKKLLLSRGEEEYGGRQNTSLLADTFEAVLGAMFLKSGIEACQKYLLEIFPDEELLSELQLKDPKSMLQEKSQSAGTGTPIYKIIDSVGPDHAKTFTVGVFIKNKQQATGTGSSKQRAEVAAAENVLKLADAKNQT